ncbi:hypothetical protein JCM19237_2288 [Photobacterium aphoticum]|uniref:Uncharacterized protein n=1 Tax=Photobacterium aphoticum TaxID=754436 RepID=A0A090R950_9GAMM|nr:hypothetical protein JCM19237_2288 [Photobacterium aphoticum]
MLHTAFALSRNSGMLLTLKSHKNNSDKYANVQSAKNNEQLT